FFVSVAYNCWAYRRQGVLLGGDTHDIKGWIYEGGSDVPRRDKPAEAAEALRGKEVELQMPIPEEAVRSLRAGDGVILNGEMHAGRDALHKHLMDNDAPIDLNGGVIYHCGPVMLKDSEGWHVKAAGPTASIREEPYQGDILKKFGLRAVIGKGGM